MALSNYAKDKFVAPFMSGFTNADVPDMSNYCDQSVHWVSNFVLSTILRVNVQDPARQYMFNYLRCAEAAFRQHGLAREATIQFVSGSRQSVSSYMMAVSHWEVFLSRAWRGYCLLKCLCDLPRIFEQGQGSVEERLNLLYNQSKHAGSVIKAGKMSESATIPVWLTNRGLQSHDVLLTYEETAEVLKDISKWAQLLQDPATIRENIEKRRT